MKKALAAALTKAMNEKGMTITDLDTILAKSDKRLTRPTIVKIMNGTGDSVMRNVFTVSEAIGIESIQFDLAGCAVTIKKRRK